MSAHPISNVRVLYVGVFVEADFTVPACWPQGNEHARRHQSHAPAFPSPAVEGLEHGARGFLGLRVEIAVVVAPGYAAITGHTITRRDRNRTVF
jgi:hypothetical protein